MSYAFCKRFPEEVAEEIFEHILNKALNNRMVDLKEVYIDGTHIKASVNKKEYQKEQVAKATRVYAKEKHGMRYTHMRGLARVANWVKLKYAAMNLKKLAEWSWNRSYFSLIFVIFPHKRERTAAFA